MGAWVPPEADSDMVFGLQDVYSEASWAPHLWKGGESQGWAEGRAELN